MLNAKKIDFKTIALIVVSTLLVCSLTIAGTMAWFTNQDSASSKELTMGEPILLTVEKDEASQIDIEVPSQYLLPGMFINPDLRVTLGKSNTLSVLRVQLTVDADTTIQEELEGQIATVMAAKAGWAEYNGWWYYLGGDANTYVMTKSYEGSEGTGTAIRGSTSLYGAAGTASSKKTPIQDTVAASIDSNAGANTITFFNQASDMFRLPSSWTQDDLAGQTITFNFEAQGLQDFVLDAAETTTVLPTIAHIARILDATYNG